MRTTMLRLAPHGTDLEREKVVRITGRGAWSQPVLGCLVGLSAGLTLATLWRVDAPSPLAWSRVALALVLSGAIVLSHRRPNLISNKTGIQFGSVPIFFLTCLFPPVVAAGAVGFGMLIGELTICRHSEYGAGHVLAQAGRWVLIVCGVSAIVHAWPAGEVAYTCGAAGALLWLGDVVTCPIVFSPLLQKSPLAVIRLAAHQSYMGELMQYLIAVLSLLVLESGFLTTGFWWADLEGSLTILLSVVLLWIYLKSEDELSRAVKVDERLYGPEFALSSLTSLDG